MLSDTYVTLYLAQLEHDGDAHTTMNACIVMLKQVTPYLLLTGLSRRCRSFPTSAWSVSFTHYYPDRCSQSAAVSRAGPGCVTLDVHGVMTYVCADEDYLTAIALSMSLGV